MSKPITAKEMVKDMLKMLDDVVADFPLEEREEAKVAILNAFSGQMFAMRMGDDA